jgi:predicted Zn-dependent protease
MVIEKVLLAAQGYIELDMPGEALRELDSLPDGARECEPAMQMRLFIVMRARQWQEAAALCERMRKVMPENSTGFIHGAFCLHEMGRTAEARALLLAGPAELKLEPTYHYNLGCYAAVLGDQEEARRYLNASFQMDKKFRDIARLDPDLRSVKELL